MAKKKQAVKATTPVTKEERDWVKENNGAPIDDNELAERASDLDGRLGDAAKAVLAAQEKFEAELTRVRYERG